ncbi:MAG TPA: bifunctional precorrin-2 dehydrogenase/sirohydrochlorin ferrochelatase [Herpetosiphonaceae bacterium]
MARDEVRPRESAPHESRGGLGQQPLAPDPWPLAPASQPAYPLVLTNLARVRCVVIGGGAVAERKVEELLDGGARPLVISPELSERLALWRLKGTIACHKRPYQPGDLAGAFLAIAAAGDRSVNQAVALEGEALGILVNVCDDPAAGNFHTVATVRRADLLLTVSTGGASPALAARIRRELAEAYGPGYKRLLPLLRALRQACGPRLDAGRRQEFWRELLAAPLLEWLESDAEDRIWALAGSLCQRLSA